MDSGLVEAHPNGSSPDGVAGDTCLYQGWEKTGTRGGIRSDSTTCPPAQDGPEQPSVDRGRFLFSGSGRRCFRGCPSPGECPRSRDADLPGPAERPSRRCAATRRGCYRPCHGQESLIPLDVASDCVLRIPSPSGTLVPSPKRFAASQQTREVADACGFADPGSEREELTHSPARKKVRLERRLVLVAVSVAEMLTPDPSTQLTSDWRLGIRRDSKLVVGPRGRSRE
jgi:hypothetical protein